ncbi:hypothetical protein M422DRAFT_28987 [Sphaerobolus stellatus SS14]|uniref:Uncharacterized protein n=1 Tax=Sphaerobolus stellatus (strain SS14) TaxID=990650 RepID=A0A0C9W461_SPHS4|nr:hypothetical protein M422DRAFT_28987 [Sphaerobolus stellatus SS14]
MNDRILDNRYQSPNLPGGTIKHTCSCNAPGFGQLLFYHISHRPLPFSCTLCRTVRSAMKSGMGQEA